MGRQAGIQTRILEGVPREEAELTVGLAGGEQYDWPPRVGRPRGTSGSRLHVAGSNQGPPWRCALSQACVLLRGQRQSFQGAESEAGEGDARAGSPLFIQTVREQFLCSGSLGYTMEQNSTEQTSGRGERSERSQQDTPASCTTG